MALLKVFLSAERRCLGVCMQQRRIEYNGMRYQNGPLRQRTTQLTRRGAIVLGGVFVVFGLVPIFAGLGLIPVRFSPGVRPWVVVAAGSMFTLAGVSFINNSALGGRQPDGNLADGSPFAVLLAGYLLNLAILGLMFTLFAWIAFGSGERHFSSWSSVAGLPLSARTSERWSRMAFGICAGILGVSLLFSAIAGAKRLRRMHF